MGRPTTVRAPPQPFRGDRRASRARSGHVRTRLEAAGGAKAAAHPELDAAASALEAAEDAKKAAEEAEATATIALEAAQAAVEKLKSPRK